jgi:hypothetical protein
MVRVTPEGTVTTIPLFIVNAQAVIFAAKGLPDPEAIIALLVACGGPLLQLVPFQVVDEASRIVTFAEATDEHPLPSVTVKVLFPAANPVTV